MTTVLITGGTGMIGKALTHALVERNYKVIILSREPASQQPTTNNISFAAWNIARQTIDSRAIQRADYIIHLAGAGVADKNVGQKNENRKLLTVVLKVGSYW